MKKNGLSETLFSRVVVAVENLSCSFWFSSDGRINFQEITSPSGVRSFVRSFVAVAIAKWRGISEPVFSRLRRSSRFFLRPPSFHWPLLRFLRVIRNCFRHLSLPFSSKTPFCRRPTDGDRPGAGAPERRMNSGCAIGMNLFLIVFFSSTLLCKFISNFSVKDVQNFLFLHRSVRSGTP